MKCEPFRSDQAKKLSIVVPCFNEAQGLDELYRRVVAAVEPLFANFEIILIDDGSRDDTWSVIERLAHHDHKVVGVKLSRNHGHTLALSAGLTRVDGDLVLVLDADLQDPPELLPQMLELMERQAADVVYGQRMSREGETAFKQISAKMFYRFLANVSEIEIPLDTGDFRLMTRRVVDVLNGMPEQDRFIRGLVTWIGYKQVPYHYHREKRFAGSTNYPFKKMLKLALDATVSFSMIPLRIAVFLAILLTIFLLMLAVYALYSYFFIGAVPGWTSLLLVFVSVSVIQTLCLAAIGEYVGRTYIQSKGRPLFVISELVGTRTTAQESSHA